MKLKVLENDREYTLFCHYQSEDLLFCLNDLYFDGEGCNLQPVYKHITTKNHMLLYAPYITSTYSTQIIDYYYKDKDINCNAKVYWAKLATNPTQPVAAQIYINGKKYNACFNDELYDQLSFYQGALPSSSDHIDGKARFQIQSLLHFVPPTICWGNIEIPIASFKQLMHDWYKEEHNLEDYKVNCEPQFIYTYNLDWHLGRIHYITEHEELLNDPIELRGNSIISPDIEDRSIKDGSHRFLANLLLDKVDIEAYFYGTAGQLEIFNGVNNSLPTIHNSVEW